MTIVEIDTDADPRKLGAMIDMAETLLREIDHPLCAVLMKPAEPEAQPVSE